MLEMGGKEQNIVKQSKRDNKPIPAGVMNAPQLLPGLEMYLRAFFDLSTDRQIGFSGLGPVPYSSIAGYAESFGLDDSETYDFAYLIKQLDAAFLTQMEEKKPKKDN